MSDLDQHLFNPYRVAFNIEVAVNRVRTEECWELLQEIHALEDVVAQRDAVIDVLRAELVLEISLRTLGGTPPPSTPLWANKFAGPPPLPYSYTDKDVPS